MKELFPGYYRKTEDELNQIWENGIIMFDTNVLLNLYRYSKETRKTILQLIEQFSQQIYLPHQAALEYNKNRYEVIVEQENTYKEFLNKIEQIQQDLQSTSKPPFFSDKVDGELKSVLNDVTSEVKNSIKEYCNYLKDDPVYGIISELFENRITTPFTQKELDLIFNEGEERFKNKIPPGFEDEKNKKGNRKYGDLVLWKQVILKAKELNKGVILVTDERKIDWWWKIKDGRIMGPRQELVEEIKKEANASFHMYSSERFISYGQTYLKQKINQKAIEEIQALKRAELETMRELEKLNLSRQRKLSLINEELRNKIVHIDNDIELLTEHINSLKNKNYELEENEHAKFHIEQLLGERNALQEERNNLTNEFRFNKNRILKYKDFERENYFKFRNQDNEK